jgi:acyl-CoA thioesterase
MREEQRQICLEAARASSFWHLLGIELVNVSDGYACLRLPVTPSIKQGYGAAHGGAITSLADSALAIALITMVEPQQRVTTVELKINFLSPVVGGEMLAEATVSHLGRRLAVGEVVVKNEGKLVATMLSTYAISR